MFVNVKDNSPIVSITNERFLIPDLEMMPEIIHLSLRKLHGFTIHFDFDQRCDPVRTQNGRHAEYPQVIEADGEQHLFLIWG